MAYAAVHESKIDTLSPFATLRRYRPLSQLLAPWQLAVSPYPPLEPLLTWACGNRSKRVARLRTPDTYWGMRSTGLIVLPAAASAAARLMAASS
jgi:hypothetical protein